MLKSYVAALLLLSSFACTEDLPEHVKGIDMPRVMSDMNASDFPKPSEEDMTDLKVELDMSIEGKPCTKTSDCIRGYSCSRSQNICTNQLFGCADLRADEGCVYDSGAGQTSPKECSSDEECKNSKYGTNCVKNVCAQYTACLQNSDCPSNVCSFYQICEE